jgi:class 3 adenylate cyclase
VFGEEGNRDRHSNLVETMVNADTALKSQLEEAKGTPLPEDAVSSNAVNLLQLPADALVDANEGSHGRQADPVPLSAEYPASEKGEKYESLDIMPDKSMHAETTEAELYHSFTDEKSTGIIESSTSIAATSRDREERNSEFEKGDIDESTCKPINVNEEPLMKNSAESPEDKPRSEQSSSPETKTKQPAVEVDSTGSKIEDDPQIMAEAAAFKHENYPKNTNKSDTQDVSNCLVSEVATSLMEDETSEGPQVLAVSNETNMEDASIEQEEEAIKSDAALIKNRSSKSILSTSTITGVDVSERKPTRVSFAKEVSIFELSAAIRTSLDETDELESLEKSSSAPIAPGHHEGNHASTGQSAPESTLTRTISADTGLMSNRELMQNLGNASDRRISLQIHIARETHGDDTTCLSSLKDCFRPERIKEDLEDGRQFTKWLVDSAQLNLSYNDLMLMVTLFVLFGNDMRILWFHPFLDSRFFVWYNIAFFLFLVEILLNCWAKTHIHEHIIKDDKDARRQKKKRSVHGYLLSFFFWLDLLAIMSMVPDIEWMMKGLGLPTSLLGTYTFGSTAGRAGKIGAKMGRLVRMVRLVRLVKLYKVTSQKRREKKMIKELESMHEDGQVPQEEIEALMCKEHSRKQSKVGAELSDIITKRVILAVLLMLCVVPLLSYSSSGLDAEEATQYLQKVNVGVPSNGTMDCNILVESASSFRTYMEPREGEIFPFLVALSVLPSRCNSAELVDFTDAATIEKVRENAVKILTFSSVDGSGAQFSVTASFNLQPVAEEASAYSIALTVFVIIVLVTLSLQFTNDAQKLVLSPLEDMMAMVQRVAQDPLSEEYDFLEETSSQYETRVVELAIQKITNLLRVGFGVAGAGIISSNMNVEGESSADLQPMIPGKRMYAIFGFCDIHSFDMYTELLKDEIMTFVNSIARIVHGEVSRWGGQCNRNLGNAFLMVWRIGDESTLLQAYKGPLKRHTHSRGKNKYSRQVVDLNKVAGENLVDSVLSSVDSRCISNPPLPTGLDEMADKALIGFLKTIIEVNRDQQVLSYRSDKRLDGSTGNTKLRLRMGFGMHAGWAIEGAVGSLQKVDATYLSPHVNMAARMEAACKQFSVAILLTERFHEVRIEQCRYPCRLYSVRCIKAKIRLTLFLLVVLAPI